MRRPSVILVSDRTALADQMQDALDPLFDLVVLVAHPPSVLSVVGAVGPAAVILDRSAYGPAVEDTLRLLRQEEPGRKLLLIDDDPVRPDWGDLSELFDVRRVPTESLLPNLLIELRRTVGHGGASWREH